MSEAADFMKLYGAELAGTFWYAVFRNPVSTVIAAFAPTGFLCGAAGPAQAGSFAERFEIIKADATPEELYRFLYDLPKGGDLDNHLSGSSRSEWWYELATDEIEHRRPGHVGFQHERRVLRRGEPLRPVVAGDLDILPRLMSEDSYGAQSGIEPDGVASAGSCCWRHYGTAHFTG